MAIACLLVPSLALTCELVERPQLAGRPVALADEGGLRVYEATSEAAQRGVRAMLVVPILVAAKFAQEVVARHRDQDAPSEFRLKREYQAFDDRDAPVLTRLAVARRLDPFAFRPMSKCRAVEDLVAVADDVLGFGGASDGSSHERTEIAACGSLGKHTDSHRTAGEMINDHADPPAKRVLLRQ